MTEVLIVKNPNHLNPNVKPAIVERNNSQTFLYQYHHIYNHDGEILINRKYIIILLLISCLIIPTVSASNWTYNFNPGTSKVEIINSTYLKEFMYYLIVTNSTGDGGTSTIWDFPVIGFGAAVMGPFTEAFKGIGIGSGAIVYLILFGLFILMVWRQSGKVTIPAMIAVITGSAWQMLFPESAGPYVMILLCVALASQLLTWFAKE